MVKCITINTDASFFHKEKIGAYAFTIVCDNFRIKRSGLLKSVNSCTDAEIMAIGNAIAFLLNSSDTPQSTWLIINTDCRPAIDAIRQSKGELGCKVHKLWIKLIAKLKSNNNKFRHVKAHTRNDSARSHVNNWCDKEAKRHARIAVATYNSKINKATEYEKLQNEGT